MTPSSGRMGRRALVLLTVLTLTGCAGETTTPNTVPDVECGEPPAVEEVSGLEMSLTPQRVAPMEVAHLEVGGGGLPDEASVGVDAMWQCWAGVRWVTTHVVYRGFGDNPGQTIPVNEVFQIHVPSIGLALDTGFPIVIPIVDPGTYRIADKVIHEHTEVEGFTLVEVVDG